MAEQPKVDLTFVKYILKKLGLKPVTPICSTASQQELRCRYHNQIKALLKIFIYENNLIQDIYVYI